jgi:hypothetical protein
MRKSTDRWVVNKTVNVDSVLETRPRARKMKISFLVEPFDRPPSGLTNFFWSNTVQGKSEVDSSLEPETYISTQKSRWSAYTIENSTPKKVDLSVRNKKIDGRIDKKIDKKRRIRLKPRQLTVLQNAFDCDAYPSAEYRKSLAAKLDLKPYQISNWFQNKRARNRKNALPVPGEF